MVLCFDYTIKKTQNKARRQNKSAPNRHAFKPRDKNKDYFGIFPKFFGTISFWFCSTIGSVTHDLAHAESPITKLHNPITKIVFFILFPLFLFWQFDSLLHLFDKICFADCFLFFTAQITQCNCFVFDFLFANNRNDWCFR